ncbi:MAG: glucose PTS transporter subunit IIA [Bdellovibrionaceae bacterium]|nr:glucose PTS transporter subunit IIA [Pseudobdellovibrionaceae bacterium]
MKNRFSGTMSVMQKLGQSLMIPVSVLPAAGLVVALGRALQNMAESSSLIYQAGQIFYSGGLAVFEQLPVIFAVGVAIGFARGSGIAALSAVAGFFTLTSLLKVFGDIRGLEVAINTGVFGGIVIGWVAAVLYNRYHETQLPAVLGFFSGKRLVPILTIFATLVISFAFALVWPPVQSGIGHFGEWVMSSNFGGAFYAAGKRLLIPVGLHHVYYQPFMFQFGEFVTATGQIVHGDSPRYYAGDPSAGVFLASEFPIMLFGLPAAALAMVLRAIPSRRKAIWGVMLSAALTSILTGITEPIEFAFIFVAPILYVAHVALAFLAGFLTQLFDIHLGYTFSASLIDFVLGYFNQKNSMYLWLVVGPIMAALYFVVFYTAIGFLDLKTPGRSEEIEDDPNEIKSTVKADSTMAASVLAALGGASNLTSLEACITRLRVAVSEPSKVDQEQLKKLGAVGIFHDGKANFQIVYGTKSDLIKEQIARLIRAEPAAVKGLQIRAPLAGRIVPLDQVPDKTFSQKILGEGVAIEPTSGRVVAPFDGTVEQIFKTAHAVGLTNSEGVEVLIHIGIDTVKLGGEGFKAFVKAGETVKAGQTLIEFDLEGIRAKAPSVVTPIVITNTADFPPKGLKNSGAVASGDLLFEVSRKG